MDRTAFMDRTRMMDRMRAGRGFIAALDQSGGSTPRALVNYGMSSGAWADEAEMFGLIHRMRCRILASPVFTADRILAVILFERTMTGAIGGIPVPRFLHGKGIVPFLKVDRGLAAEKDGVRLMKPLDRLDGPLRRATELGMFGTKMRSVILSANPRGITAVVEQQFEIAERIADSGLVPILEPEYAIDAPDRARGEAVLCAALLDSVALLARNRRVILKLSIPVEADTYLDLVNHPGVLRVVALSGGHGRREACTRLALNAGMVACFGRALIEDLRVTMTPAEFDGTLAMAIEEIYRASVRSPA